MIGATLAHRDGRPPTCSACGFDLTGLPVPVDGAIVCPECGQPVPLEHAYSTTPERIAEWLQKPAEPSPGRFLLTTVVTIVAGGVAAVVVAALIYLILTVLFAWSANP